MKGARTAAKKKDAALRQKEAALRSIGTRLERLARAADEGAEADGRMREHTELLRQAVAAQATQASAQVRGALPERAA